MLAEVADRGLRPVELALALDHEDQLPEGEGPGLQKGLRIGLMTTHFRHAALAARVEPPAVDLRALAGADLQQARLLVVRRAAGVQPPDRHLRKILILLIPLAFPDVM